MSDEVSKAREELDRQKRKTDHRAEDAKDLASWFRSQHRENGWRVMIEQIITKGTA
jgi:hypothetical protein